LCSRVVSRGVEARSLFGICTSSGSALSMNSNTFGAFVTCNYRIIERFGLEGTFKDHLLQTPCRGQEHLSLNQVAQSPIQPDFEHSKSWYIHNFSRQHIPVPHYAHLKNFFSTSNLNLPSVNLKPLALDLLLQALVKSFSPSFL